MREVWVFSLTGLLSAVATLKLYGGNIISFAEAVPIDETRIMVIKIASFLKLCMRTP
jgi:hypothetical protein